jgi:hypothetical protein
MKAGFTSLRQLASVIITFGPRKCSSTMHCQVKKVMFVIFSIPVELLSNILFLEIVLSHPSIKKDYAHKGATVFFFGKQKRFSLSIHCILQTWHPVTFFVFLD